MANSDSYNQQVGKIGTDFCSLTHREERDGDSAGSTRAFPGAESASLNLHRKRLWRITKEESSVLVRQHFVLSNTRSLFHSSPSLL